ncbi:hypothetical protein TREMEDRAFT_31426 [Tremella mesenterica DSM 1558]|uniref:uncharacterized protein n=1 Tax=Tremella mesenterica (strain ATCC 24925 / CBS 8224 / DSM 1558 / NBRC 9311 / NRRL Y-6157 / RJB 2259-6 / UBC 559-6) TaxID=578456 RepID=UPI0003F491E6|nr:uncharacterized protein TREMEDRAFT_31426 [Tremella mesenterica DSM 1558]EIW69048.1 hypothetical protein TREMEDRAFT_31426 [Tremella mesenterica DSM 1558]
MTIPKTLGEVPREKKKEEKESLRDMLKKAKKLLPHLWPSKNGRLQLACLGALIIVLIGRVIGPITPLAYGGVVRALTNYRGTDDIGALMKPFGIYLAIQLGFQTSPSPLSIIRQVIWMPVSQNVDRQMANVMFDHLLNLSLGFHTKRNSGELQRIVDRGSSINSMLETLLFTVIPTLLDLVIAFGVFFFFYGWALTITMISIMSIYLALSFYRTNTMKEHRRAYISADIKSRGIVSDALTNWESIKYFTSEQREVNRHDGSVLYFQSMSRKWIKMSYIFELLISLTTMLGMLLGEFIIAIRVIHGQADPADFVIFASYLSRLQSPLSSLNYLYRSIQNNMTDAEKMIDLLDEKADVNDLPEAKDLIITDGVIEFRNVSFSYDGEVQALKNVSFTVGKGQSMALVGRSGSGKSTVLRLLYRFYDVGEGQIFIDGQDIAHVTQLSLRQAIGIVPQDNVLWNDSLGANIAYGKPGCTDDEIIDAAIAAQIHDKIMSMPDEYASVVGERGVRLSGGEKQRVSLARMFVKAPKILVLDEATSALDTETERGIQEALKKLSKNRTSLSIAHRLSTIVHSDVIVVMDEGSIVEMGSYRELLRKKGAFESM